MSDLISRQDAIALVDRPIAPTGDAVYDNAREDERASIKDDLLSLPPAEPKTGEWTDAGLLTVCCSNCKSQFHELEAMNYCPNCGADMRGEEER